MRFHLGLDTLLSPPSKVKLLRVLLRSSRREFTGRELSRASGVTGPALSRSLRDLEETGIVRAKVVGRAQVWSLSPSHVWTSRLRKLFEEESSSREELCRFLGGRVPWGLVTRAVLFGSVARGEDREGSDIDFYVEARSDAAVDEVSSRLGGLSLEVARRYGNTLTSLVYGPSQLRRPPNPALLSEIERDGVLVRRAA
ncbi:MAG: nucleotidyltransferase domain-containing protein [Euryarchaeota archaeon]|nr:nucleotidyltransferase domain-containing protein [Euryarchaeota archaeon]MDE1837927.1 nucleotidyltransferase domain-containing protein [Euryarchaeota archaeon]MDE1880171.1 nucleotidyltransferase domain-containing protein [Euryarchaeota archaeon]MDE2045388.1 nucleotidyltransferase domain-containing protein [Thermoplasmata archaeon]